MVVACILLASRPRALVEYVPVVSDSRQALVQDRSLLTPAHLDRMEVVLKSYNQPYTRVDANHLLISRALSRDTDLLWNYTTKAEDPKFDPTSLAK